VPPDASQPELEGDQYFDLRSWLEGKDPAALEALQVQTCALRPGEIIYVPEGWRHATMDLTETFGTNVLFGGALTDEYWNEARE